MILFVLLILFVLRWIICSEEDESVFNFNCSSIGGFLVETTNRKKCLKFFSDEEVQKWRFAKTVCKGFHPSSYLGVFTSAEERVKILEHVLEEKVSGNYWLGFLPRLFEGEDNNIRDYEVVGLDSTVFDYTSWSEAVLQKTNIPTSLSKGKCRKCWTSKYCMFFTTDQENVMGTEERVMWHLGNCNSAEAKPFCEIDLSMPELLHPSIENTYSVVEPSPSSTEPSSSVYHYCERESERKNIIVQIGHNRCGTTSLHRFFIDNGFSGLDGGYGSQCRFDRVGATMYKNYVDKKMLFTNLPEECLFFSDMEYFPQVQAYRKFFKLIDHQYPHSKFILNVRDKQNWMRSRIFHQGGQYLNVTSTYLNWTREETIHFWGEFFDLHNQQVVDYFRGRPEKLLVFDIEKDGPEKLVQFLREWYPDLKEEHWGKHNPGTHSVEETIQLTQVVVERKTDN